MGESSDSGGGGNDEPQGTVFGVDGVSKTGSTSQDQQIGYTDGQGGKGSNYDALQGATSQQTSAAVAAANKTKASGGNETAQQAAVSNVLESYDPGFVNRSGNLTESGQSAINRAAQEAIEDTAEFERIQASAPPAGAALANIGDVTQPSMNQNLLTSLDLGPQASLADPEAAALRAPPDPNRPLTVAEERNLVNMFSERGLDPAAGQEAERQRQAQRQQALETLQRNLGITTLPEAATAAAVLQGSIPEFDMDDREGDYLLNPSLRPAPMTLPVPPPANRRQQTVAQPPMEQNLLTSLDLGTGTTAPASDFLARNPQPDAGGNLVNPLLQTGTAPMDVSGAASQFTDAMMTDSGVRGVGSIPMAPVQRDGQFTIGGVPVTEDLANMAIQMRGDIYDALPSPAAGIIDKGVSLFTGQDPVTRAATQYGEFLNLPGAMIDPDTGNISAPAGRGTLNLKNQGALAGTVTYSGVQDPNYSGPYENLVNPPAQTSEDGAMTTDVAKSPQDPCPPGYQLVNGVCQPVDDVTTAPPGSGFQFFPSGGFPTSFQPVTQATQVGQVNPFVLRPNVPQGIQGLSPTGAALGRQV